MSYDLLSEAAQRLARAQAGGERGAVRGAAQPRDEQAGGVDDLPPAQILGLPWARLQTAARGLAVRGGGVARHRTLQGKRVKG